MGLVIRQQGERTRLFGRTKERVEEQWRIIDRDCLSFWRRFRKTGLAFEGTPVDVFWMDRDPGDKPGAPIPFRAVKKAIRAVLDDTEATCRGHDLEPERYVDEAAVMLEGLAESVYWDMAGIEIRLCTSPHERVTPEVEVRWRERRAPRAKICADRLKRYIAEQAEAAKLLGQASKERRQAGGTIYDIDPKKWVKISESRSEGSGDEEWEIRPKKTNAKDRFTFPTGLALFDRNDLDLKATFARDVLKKLTRRTGKVVCYRTLDRDSQAKEASEKLRTAVVALRKCLRKNKTGYKITTIRGTGYCLHEKIVSRSPHDNSR